MDGGNSDNDDEKIRLDRFICENALCRRFEQFKGLGIAFRLDIHSNK